MHGSFCKIFKLIYFYVLFGKIIIFDLRKVTPDSIHATLREWADDVYIIRYREDTRQLASVLQGEGFAVHLQEGPYTAEQLTYSPSIQCLVNHANAWARVAAGTRAAIIVEPDFVPVRGFGGRPCPMPRVPADPRVGIAWLYGCGTILNGMDEFGYLHGHAASVAGYIVTPAVAAMLLDFFASEMQRDDPGHYRPWDVTLGGYLRQEKGLLNYLPLYQLGEHGSDSRAEHAEHGMRKNWHQADILAGPLSFLPIYARGSRWRLARYRLRGWVWGWLRLLTRRYFHPGNVRDDSARGPVFISALSVLRLLRLVRVLGVRSTGEAASPG